MLNPSEFRGYTLDSDAFTAALADAPLEGSRAARRGGAVAIVVPAPTGELATFSVVESPVMESELQAANPDIRTYVGNEATTGDSISLVTTPDGVHASVRGDHPSWYVDPAYQNDESLYLSFFGQALPLQAQSLLEPKLSRKLRKQERREQRIRNQSPQRIGEGPDGLVKERTYKIAFLTDNTYAEYVAPGLNDGTQDAASNSAVLSAKALLMARVNQIYNADLAIKMILVNASDKLNLNTAAKMTGANGPCGITACYTAAQATGCTSSTLGRNRLVVGLLVGAENFDVGHIGFGLNGGGIASLGVVGGSSKAQGCTGLPQPIGDFYAVDYVAHEIGHQFAGNHTFNGTQVNCAGGNRSAANSYEPGSGSSVMAYAGICGSDDLQPHTDPFFSLRSQFEIGNLANTTPVTLNEVQMVGLYNFDGTDSFRLDFGGVQTAPLVNGTNYTSAGVKAAVEAAIGGTVTVANFFATGSFDGRGFQLTYTGTLAGTNLVNPTVVPVDGDVTGIANDITKGGLSTPGGSTITTTTNHNPTVTAPAAKSIPLRTPFALTGSAVDSDNDSMIYLWEQTDRGNAATGLIDNNKLNGPLFRVFGKYANVVGADTLLYNSPGENMATTSPSRTFPDMDQILAGATNAATGACPTPAPSDYKNGASGSLKDGPVLECYSEFLPTTAYLGFVSAGNATPPSLDFRLTARDQRAGGGGTQFADVKLTLATGTGPFQVTSQAATASYNGDSSLPITWDVNGTNVPTLAENVKISLSTDGGLTFPTVLAASTPNDGTESVTLPNVSTTTARLKIEAVDNYFFDVNDAPFTIVRQALVNTTAPSISGTPSVGSTLTADPGTWSPSGVSFAYQWFANGLAIDGATLQQFTPTAAQDGKFVLVRVIATRAGYDPVAAASPNVRIATTPITNSVAPFISGTATVGQTLTLSDGTWNYGDLTYSYRWYANGAAIRGASGSSYVIPASMVGKSITGRVTATRPGNDAVTAVSSNTIVPS